MHVYQLLPGGAAGVVVLWSSVVVGRGSVFVFALLLVVGPAAKG